MNIKRPSIIFSISAIIGIIFSYSKMYVIDKALAFSITFLLLIFLLYKKKLKIYAAIICIMISSIYSYRFYSLNLYFDNIDKYIENNIDKNSELYGVVTDFGKSTNSNFLEISNVAHEDKNIGKLKCYYKDDILKEELKIGYKIKFGGKLYRFEKSANVGQFDNQNYYRSLGFSTNMSASNINIVDRTEDKFMQKIYDVKCIVKNQVNKIFTTKNAGLFNCMITGDKSSIDKDQKNLFNENGIAHILAISGLHLSILGLGFFELLRKKFRLRTSAFIVSIFILLYGLFIDCSASSLRAIIMLYVRFLALSIGRTYDSKNTLYILLSIFLMINPYYLFNAGFLFSYMAIFSLNMRYDIKVNANNKIAKSINKIKNRIALSGNNVINNKNSMIKIPSVIILTLFLLPITIYNYFTYPLYSILLNLIVIPLMTFVLFFGLLGTAVSFICVPLGRFFVGIVHVIFVLYENLCLLVEKLSYHKLLIGKPCFKCVVIYYVVLLFIYYIINKHNENINYIDEIIYGDEYNNEDKCNYRNIININIKNESLTKNDKYANKNHILCDSFDRAVFKIFYSNKKVTACVLTLSLIVSIFLLGFHYQNGLKISCLSIGQGDSFVIKNDDGKVYTIDGGSTSNTSNGQYILVPNLKANQISTIEKAYISHSDADHTNAIMYIIENEEDIKVKEVILPIVAYNNEKYDKIVSICNDNDVDVRYIKRGDVESLNDNFYFDCISPSDKNTKLNKDLNEASMCLKLNYKNHSMLFTGDMGKDMEKEILRDKDINDDLKSDILKVAHHGSKSASSKDFINAVEPKISIISYGYKNSYGHPHKETIRTLQNVDDMKIYNTVDDGEIDIFINKDVNIKTYYFR